MVKLEPTNNILKDEKLREILTVKTLNKEAVDTEARHTSLFTLGH